MMRMMAKRFALIKLDADRHPVVNEADLTLFARVVQGQRLGGHGEESGAGR
jgi:hypothetical protein